MVYECSTRPAHAENPGRLDDEVAALRLQLEEIDSYDRKSKGKYPANNPPDTGIAYSTFQYEIEGCIDVLSDLKLAHSIACAVETDAQAIAGLLREEAQAQQDRHLAVTTGGDTPENEAPPPYNIQEECTRSIACLPDEDSDECTAGPSGTHSNYATRQGKALERLSQVAGQCCVCLDRFRPYQIVRLQCGDSYCVGCLKHLFMRSIKDQSLFPPRCCRQGISLALIAAEMSTEEIETFHSAEVEFSTADRTYCSNTDCGKFVRPDQIKAGRAECDRCGSATCSMCKNAFHPDDCAADPLLQAALALATSQGWQRCFNCRALVELNTGCYHMSCTCGSEFCYLCGLRWKTCSCERWSERNLGIRAEEVVDREAVIPIPQVERQRRVGQMREELLENHECDHPGRFERIFGGAGSRGFRCEMCGDRHRKYILQCRRCHERVCEDCRRNRVR